MTSSFKRNSKRAHNIITTAVITHGPSTTTSTHLAPPSVAKGMSRSPSGSGKSVTFITEDDGSTKRNRNNNKEEQQQTSQKANFIITGSGSTSGIGCSNGNSNSAATNNGDIIPMTTLGDNVNGKQQDASTTTSLLHGSSTSSGIVESQLGITAGNDSRPTDFQK